MRLKTCNAKELSAFPNGTQFDSLGIGVGLWGGRLALVIHGRFDYATLSVCYSVWPLLRYDSERGRVSGEVEPEPWMVGHEVPVDLELRPGAQFRLHRTGSRMDPFGSDVLVALGRREQYLIPVDWKHLSASLWDEVEEAFGSDGLIDVTWLRDGDRRLVRLRRNQWKRLVNARHFEQTQEMDRDLANAAYWLVVEVLGDHPRDTREEDRGWESIGGVYKRTRDGKGVSMLVQRDW